MLVQAVVETVDYLADARSAGINEAARRSIVDFIAANPIAGELMQGTSGARKVRFAGRGKGKSGGYRVVTYFGGDDVPVFLLAMYGKGDRDNLSKAERNELRKELAGLATDYRTARRKAFFRRE